MSQEPSNPGATARIPPEQTSRNVAVCRAVGPVGAAGLGGVAEPIVAINAEAV